MNYILYAVEDLPIFRQVTSVLVVSQVLIKEMPLPLVTDEGMAMYTLKLWNPSFPLELMVMAGRVRVKVALCLPIDEGL